MVGAQGLDLLLPLRADRHAGGGDHALGVASAAGVVSSIESFVGELVNNKDFRLLSWEVLRAATLIGLVIVCLLTVMTVLAAAFYNLFSELLGGIEVTVVEQEELSR